MKWLLIYTKAQGEVPAHQALLDKGFNSYLPMMYADKKITTKTKVVPLFPRYIFVQFCEGEDNMNDIKTLHSVSNIVYFGGNPAYAHTGLIDTLKQRENDLGLIDIYSDYQPGDEVRIKSGIYKDYQAVFKHLCKRDRCAILLATGVIATLDKKDIEIIE